MGTNEICLEKVQALLKIDTGSGSLHEHLTRVVRKLAEDKPAQALEALESLSRDLKQAQFRGAPSPDENLTPVVDGAAEEKLKQWCMDTLQVVREPSDPGTAPRVLAAVQNFMEDAPMFEWAGVGFGKQESFRIAMSLRKLSIDVPSLEGLRLWGKILGTEGDYYVAEGTLQAPPGAVPAPAAVPGTPEYAVEERGVGANTFAYWVTDGGANPWIRLPSARADHIVAARVCQRLMTGNLGSPVHSTPWFPGKERHLLRAQIARITSTCTLCVKGWYEADEEAGKNKIKQAEETDALFNHEELATQAGWNHASPHLLSTGKSTWPDLEAFPEGTLSEAQTAEIQAAAENEAEKGMLEGLEADLEEIKPEDAEGSPAWSIKVFGDKALYTFADSQKSHRVTAVRSNIWPGAVTVAQGTRYANIYVGYGLKSGALVGPDPKTGLPLRGTCPFSPLEPGDIMEEPKDLEEQEEPNPQQDEAESDHEGSVDADPDA